MANGSAWSAVEEVGKDGFEEASDVLNYLILAMGLLGALSNGVSVWIFTRAQMKSSINVLLSGLSLVDGVLCAVSVPVMPVPVLWSDADAVKFFARPLTYKFVYPVALFSQTASIWLMVLITVERWVAVCHPLQARNLCTITRSRLGLALMLLLSALYNLCRYWEYSLLPRAPSANASANASLLPTTPAFEGGYEVEPFLRASSTYTILYECVAYLLVQFILPFFFLLLFNGQMVRTIMRVRRNSRDLSRQEKGEHKTAVMMIVVVLIFLLTNTTAVLLNFVQALPEMSISGTVWWMVLDANNLLVVTNSATTFVIYWLFSQRYRRIFLLTFRHCLPRRWLPSPEELAFGLRSGASYVGNTAFSRLTGPTDASPAPRRSTNPRLSSLRRPSDSDSARTLLASHRQPEPRNGADALPMGPLSHHASLPVNALHQPPRPRSPTSPVLPPRAQPPPRPPPSPSHLPSGLAQASPAAYPRPQNAVEWMSCL